MEKLSQALETEQVSKNIHKWIDLIFGYKQRGKASKLADNWFHPLCYEGSIDIEKIYDLEDRYAKEVQIAEFGQVPKQLFTSPHPAKIMNNNEAIIEDVEDAGDIIPASVHRLSNYDVIKYWKYDMSALQMVCDYQLHKEPVSTVAMSVDNLWVFSSSHDSKLLMYSIEEMQPVRQVTMGNLNISCCFPMPNNKTVLVTSWNHSICAYSIEYGRTSHVGEYFKSCELTKIIEIFPSLSYLDEAHRDAITCTDWHKGILATGSWDATVKVGVLN